MLAIWNIYAYNIQNFKFEGSQIYLVTRFFSLIQFIYIYFSLTIVSL